MAIQKIAVRAVFPTKMRAGAFEKTELGMNVLGRCIWVVEDEAWHDGNLVPREECQRFESLLTGMLDFEAAQSVVRATIEPQSDLVEPSLLERGQDCRVAQQVTWMGHDLKPDLELALN